MGFCTEDSEPYRFSRDTVLAQGSPLLDGKERHKIAPPFPCYGATFFHSGFPVPPVKRYPAMRSPKEKVPGREISEFDFVLLV